MNGLRISLSVCTLLFIAGCSSTKVANAPEGGYLITCNKGMKDCVSQAGKLCGDDGYTVMGGESRTKMLGGSSSAYQQVSEYAHLEVRCGEVEQPGEPEYRLPERSDAPSATPQKDPSPAAPARLCVPGASQACVGPGGCSGGQSCQADGQAFGPCDCGGAAKAPVTAPPEGKNPMEGGDQAPEGEPAVPGAAPPATPL